MYHTRVRRTVLAGIAVVALAASAACDTADAADRPEPPKKGGALRVVVSVLPEHLDPQKISAALDANVSRLITRTLTTAKSEPGAGASEIVGDLATDTGRPSDDKRVWDFTLKKGLRWQDGSLITCEHVKYGVERNFSDLFTSGLQYPRQLLLDNPEPYKGPLRGTNEGLDSVTCVDQSTIQFKLKQPMGDFGYAVALPVFAPVPLGKDADKEAYDRAPFSTGPYKVAESDAKHIVLDRNPHWSASTDSVRKAYPDRIDIVLDKNTPAVTNALVQDQGDARNTVLFDVDIAPNFVQQIVNDDQLSKRMITGSYSGVRYFAINMERITDVRCRQALVFAVNKRKFRSAMGGSMFGELATSIISPQLRSHKEFDLYSAKSKPEGDRDKALQLMEEARAAGKPCKDRVRLAYPDSAVRRRLVQTVVESLQRVGIATQLIPVLPPVENPADCPRGATCTDYFDAAIGNPKNQYDLMWAGWIADWSNGSAVIPPLFSSAVIPKGEGATGNKNFALLHDKAVDDLIEAAMAESDLDTQYRLWGELDQKIQEQAPIIPMLYMKALRFAGSNVRGGFIHPAFGQPDLCSLGLGTP
jgi:peptide/nickel transport system substrate-binding protein